MKRTVSCKDYITQKILRNPTPVVTKGLNHQKRWPDLAWRKRERPTERPVSLSKNGG
jgi:hypothetical protein